MFIREIREQFFSSKLNCYNIYQGSRIYWNDISAPEFSRIDDKNILQGGRDPLEPEFFYADPFKYFFYLLFKGIALFRQYMDVAAENRCLLDKGEPGNMVKNFNQMFHVQGVDLIGEGAF